MSLAETGYAPSILPTSTNQAVRSGRSSSSSLLRPLKNINLTVNGPLVFNWLLALTSLSMLFTWGPICLCHIHFRKPWRVQAHSIEKPLPRHDWCLGLLAPHHLVLIAQFCIAISPVSGTPPNPSDVATAFFQAYLALPVVMLLCIVGYAGTPRRSESTPGVQRSMFDVSSCLGG